MRKNIFPKTISETNPFGKRVISQTLFRKLFCSQTRTAGGFFAAVSAGKITPDLCALVCLLRASVSLWFGVVAAARFRGSRGYLFFVRHKKNEKEHLNHREHGDTEKKEEHGDFAYYIQPKRPNEIRKMPFSRKDKSQKENRFICLLFVYLVYLAVHRRMIFFNRGICERGEKKTFS